MRFTEAQYKQAVENLIAASSQLEPDGNPCSVCGDSGHMAFECGHNPLVAILICNQISKQSSDLHETLHYLAGFDCPFGVQIGPTKVVMPEA